MRVAALCDVHGNAPALRAVLADLDRLGADAIVVGGDVVGGPQPRECLELLDARPEPVHWIAGNGEREAVAAFDGSVVADDPAGRAAAWTARALDRAWRDRLASWPIALTLDGICFCHGSPGRDDEILTRATPDATLAEALSPASEAVVVGGHTHQQVVRSLPDGRVYVNAGAVGMPYEGRPGAFWAMVDAGVPELRCTPYDLDAAAAELRATGFPDVEDLLAESLLAPVDPEWVTRFFEQAAGRG